MQIEKIYFDLDGVLADFDRGIEELGGIKMVPQSEATEESDAAIWDVVRNVEHFYDKLEPVNGAIEMFLKLYETYGTKCEILSAVPKPYRNVPTAREDKITWVRRLLPKDVKINLVYRAEKQDFAKGKGCILVDDYQINTDEWNQAGGTGVLFETAEKTLAKIEQLV